MLRGFLMSIVIACVALAAQGGDAVVNTDQVGTVKVELDDFSVPSGLNVQGYLTDDQGHPIRGNKSIIFTLKNEGGTTLWDSTLNVEVTEGLFSVNLNIPASHFMDGTRRWLEFTVEGQPLTPGVEVTSTAFAFRSIKSDTALYASISRPISPPISTNEIANDAVTVDKLAHNINAQPIGFNADKVDGEDASAFADAVHHHTLTYGRDLSGSGQVTGTVNATVVGLQGRPVSSVAPSPNRVLKWNGSQWAPGVDETGGSDTARFVRFTGSATPVRVNSGDSTAVRISGGSSSLGVPAILVDSCKKGIHINTQSEGITMYGPGSGIGMRIEDFTYGITMQDVNYGVELNCARTAGHLYTDRQTDYVAEFYNDGGSSCPGIYVDGYITSTGSFEAYVATPKGPVAMTCPVSTEATVMCRGSSCLRDGAAEVVFSLEFAGATTDEAPPTVVVTPRGPVSVYIAEKSASGFRVATVAGDSGAEFDWIAIGRRKGYESRPNIVIPDTEARGEARMTRGRRDGLSGSEGEQR